jgi:signal transduction histidine kinase
LASARRSDLYWGMARRTSISRRLFLLVFGFSVAWFTGTTLVQMVFEYRGTRATAEAGLTDVYLATQAGLENALWSYDLGLVHQSLLAIRSVRSLSGLLVVDEDGKVVETWGHVPRTVAAVGPEGSNVDDLGAPLYQRYELRYLDGGGTLRTVGHLVLAADFSLLGARLADRARLIVINYLANTLGLMVILVLGLRRLVSRPLGRITKAIEDYRFDRAGFVPEVRRGRPDELAVLWKSFESLTLVLKESWLQQRVMAVIFEEAAIMALVCDDAGQVISTNAQARSRLTGGVPGGSLANLTYGGDKTPLFAEPHRLLVEGQAWRGQVTAHGALGEEYWLTVALLPLQVPDEPRARWGVLIDDVSAQRLNELYRRERDLARDVARNKSLFLANLSHEIRTPMNAVVGLTALVQQEVVSPRARELLVELQRSGTSLLGVINDILDYSKLEDDKVTLESVEFRIDTVLEIIEALNRYQALEKNLKLTVSQDPRAATVLRGDPLRVRQVLSNLAANAVKFTDRGSVEVVVLPGATPDKVRFEVRDTGIGIGVADQEKLFHSFTQVDASTTRKYGGTGLGLAICKQLVHLMGGTLGVQSQPGVGSVFWFEIGETVVRPAAGDHGLAGLRVLLAEDNKVNQLVAREILAQVGIQPVVVSNGRLAVEKARSAPFDLVLMDLQMPVMDGLEASRTLRETFTADELPILALTAHTVSQERQTCRDAGMQDLVAKPVDPVVLYSMLTRWRPARTKA